MRSRIELQVDGLPPKKDGATSMWGKASERDRLKALRRAAWEAPGRQNWDTGGEISLTLTVFAEDRAGDLDNFVTGVCDGLQPAGIMAAISPDDWSDLPEEARPDRVLLIADDRTVSRIVAERRPMGGGQEHYIVVLEQ